MGFLPRYYGSHTAVLFDVAMTAAVTTGSHSTTSNDSSESAIPSYERRQDRRQDETPGANPVTRGGAYSVGSMAWSEEHLYSGIKAVDKSEATECHTGTSLWTRNSLRQ